MERKIGEYSFFCVVRVAVFTGSIPCVFTHDKLRETSY